MIAGGLRCCLLMSAAAIGALVCGDARAQDATLDSNPAGSHLVIKGPARISGVAPLPIGDLPPGQYTLTADGPGLPLVRGRFVRTADGIVSRAWAGYSSAIFPPGLAHLSRGEKRGWIFLGAGFGGAVMGAISQARLEDARNAELRAERFYSSAISEREIRSARIALADANRRSADEAEIRDLWLGMLAYAWAAAGIESILLTPQPEIRVGQAGGYLADLPRAGGLKAGLRSLFVPGAGQRYMGHGGKATFFAAATAVLGAGALVAHEEFLDARRAQAAAQGRFQSAESESEIRDARSGLQAAADDADEKNLIQWYLLGAGAAVYVWNVFDAFGIDHQEGSPALALTIRPASPSGPGMRLGASWSFQ